MNSLYSSPWCTSRNPQWTFRSPKSLDPTSTVHHHISQYSTLHSPLCSILYSCGLHSYHPSFIVCLIIVCLISVALKRLLTQEVEGRFSTKLLLCCVPTAQFLKLVIKNCLVWINILVSNHLIRHKKKLFITIASIIRLELLAPD